MKIKPWLTTTLAALFILGALAGCAAAPTPIPANKDSTPGLANPWVDATPAQAAQVLGGTFYNITTLDSSYEQYALIVTTDDAVKTGMKPTAWVRFRKGDGDISLQMFKGSKMDDELLKGEKADLNGVTAYILQKDDGTSHIAWETNGILFEIGSYPALDNNALMALAQGVKAQ